MEIKYFLKFKFTLRNSKKYIAGNETSLSYFLKLKQVFLIPPPFLKWLQWIYRIDIPYIPSQSTKNLYPRSYFWGSIYRTLRKLKLLSFILPICLSHFLIRTTIFILWIFPNPQKGFYPLNSTFHIILYFLISLRNEGDITILPRLHFSQFMDV